MEKTTIHSFSNLEKQIIFLLCQGLTAKESAKILHLNAHNIEDALRTIKRRLNISNANSARIVAFIFENGMDKEIYIPSSFILLK